MEVTNFVEKARGKRNADRALSWHRPYYMVVSPLWPGRENAHGFALN